MPKAVLPALVLEIAFGILVGPHGLGFLSPGPSMELFAQIGLAIPMVIAGLEVDFGALLARPQGAQRVRPLILAILISLLTLAMAGLGAWLLPDPGTPLVPLALDRKSDA